MTCELCKNKHATIHITEIIQGDKREFHICSECARKQGLTHKVQLSLTELLPGVGIKLKKPGRREKNVRCPNCGLDLKTLRHRVRLGCPHDLEVFKNWLEPFIERVHQNRQHVGKIPGNVDQHRKREARLLRLKRELDEAVRREDFEKAARLRDRIREFESGAK